MLKAIPFLKDAIAKGPNAGALGQYFFHDGIIHARNNAMHAGAPCETDAPGAFAIPSDELEAALSRMAKNPRLSLGADDILTLVSGRIKVAIQCVQGDPPPMPDMAHEWASVPAALLPALKASLPFISEGTDWRSGIRISDERITAINNRSAIDIYVPELAHPMALISAECVEFMTGRDTPDEFAVSDGATYFRWVDGRWICLQHLIGQMPESVERILDGAGSDVPVEITADWREVFADAFALADNLIEVRPDGLRCGKGASRIEIHFPIDNLTSNSRWAAKDLAMIVAVASHWNPDAYAQQKPAAFRGPNLRGIVVGLRA